MYKVWFKLSSIAIVLAIVFSFVPQGAAVVKAVSDTVVISQVYGGGGNSGAIYTHDFVELFNRGPAPVSLAGWSIQYTSPTGTGNLGSNSAQLTELPAVVLQPGQYFLVQEATNANVGIALPAPDTTDTNPIPMGAGAGKVALVNSTTTLGCNGGSTPCTAEQLALIIDLVGYGNANFFEGSAAAPTASSTMAVLRSSNGCSDTDQNGADFTAATPAPRNTASPLNACAVADLAPQVQSIAPADGAIEVAFDANLSVTFSEDVSLVGDWFSLACPASGDHTATVSGGPAAYLIDPETDLLAGETCTLTVYAAQVTDLDALDPPDAMAADFSSAFTTIFTEPDTAPAVSSVFPANGAVDVPLNVDLSLAFSEPVDVSAGWFTLACSLSGTHAAAVSGDADVYTLNPSANFSPGETCTLTVDMDLVTDQDGNDPPDGLEADFTTSFQTSADACAFVTTPIFEIQGDGAATPIPGPVTTSGVVVGDYEYPGSGSTSSFLRGFYIQDPAGDGNASTSDGIFVFNGSTQSVSLGDLVTVTGSAVEFQNQTQIGNVTSIVQCGTASIEPVELTFPLPSETYLEQFEGMLVSLPDMVVSEHYLLGRFGQVTLSLGDRLYQPTSLVEPGPPAIAKQAENNLRKIILDDGTNLQNPATILFARDDQPLTAANTLRGGDIATGIVGVLTYNYGGASASPNAYRVRPVNAMEGAYHFEAANQRPTSPVDVGGELTVTGMNLLNYFNTFGEDNCTYGLGGGITDCRGASDSAEFERQYVKTVAAILAMDPDVIGVNEIENDGYAVTSSLQDLVDRLNAASGPGTYAFIDADAATGQVNALGTDAIKVGMLYKPGVVSPQGVAALNSVEFVNGGDSEPRTRPALAVTFKQISDEALFTVVANHFKSKGTPCTTPDAGDGQGNCNTVRTRSAIELAAWLATDPTGSGDPDVLIIGDLNSYAMEDPIETLTGAGYTNLVSQFLGAEAYSYVFDGQWGYLDHALANATLFPQVSGLTEYHINADEPTILDYTLDFKEDQDPALYAPDQYRISDHDPIIVGLNLSPNLVVDAGGPYSVDEGGQVLVSATGQDLDGGPVTFDWDLDGDDVFETAGQTAVFSAVDGPATITIKARVTGEGGDTAVAVSTVTVNNILPTVNAIQVSKAWTAVGKGVTFTATFSDPGILDTHSGVWDWGDGTTTPAVVNQGSGVGLATGNHTFSAAGLYQVTLVVTDKDGGSGQAVYDEYIVYDPDGGWVSGAGIFNSPAGAFPAKPDLAGRASFAFTSRYLFHQNTPTGVTAFEFILGKLIFTSVNTQWMVVEENPDTAILKGTGKINGKGTYQFMVWALDGSPDTFRIRIWSVQNGNDVVIYDNQANQLLRTGSVSIRD